MTDDRLTIQHIRFYQVHHRPEKFGRMVRFLNWIRWNLELYVQRLVLRSLHKKSGEPLPLSVFEAQFEADVSAEKLAYSSGILPKQKRVVCPENLGNPVDESTVVFVPRGKSLISPPQQSDHPPKPLDNLIAKYVMGAGRMDTSSKVVEDFERIPKSTLPGAMSAEAMSLPVPSGAIKGEFVLSGKKKGV